MHVVHSNEEHPDEMEQDEQGKIQNIQIGEKEGTKKVEWS